MVVLYVVLSLLSNRIAHLRQARIVELKVENECVM